MKREIILFLIFCAIMTNSTVKAQVTIGSNASPTESIEVYGTTRVRSLPANGTANAISTKPDGTASAAKDQIFTATRTVVADANGVLGSVVGLPSSGSEWSTSSYTVNASSDYQTIDLSGETTLKDLYVINDQTNSSNGYSIIVQLPLNVTSSTTSRVIRFIDIPTGTTNLSGLSFSGNIGNRSVTNVNAITITQGATGSVRLGSSNIARFETIITFVEINGKWYVDRMIAKAN